MSNTQPSQNLVPNEPTLNDLLDLLKKEIMLNLNCHHLGTIQSFDSENQTCTATINYSKTFFQLDEQTKTYKAILQDYPLAVDLPIIILGGGNANLTFPIQKGDQCIILFNDRSIDNWFQSGLAGPVAATRYHAFSDGIALIGLRNLNTSLENYDTNRAVLFNGTTGVGVSADKIRIYNATTTLNTLLQNILTQLEALANSICANGSPIAPTVATALSSLATQLGDLIE